MAKIIPQSPAEFNKVPAFWLLADLCCQSLPSAAFSGNLPKYICCIDQVSTDQRQCMVSSARISDLWIADFGRARRSIWLWATLDEDSSDLMLGTRMLSARWNAPPSPWRMRGRYSLGKKQAGTRKWAKANACEKQLGRTSLLPRSVHDWIAIQFGVTHGMILPEFVQLLKASSLLL